jgi:hypothetical protein
MIEIERIHNLKEKVMYVLERFPDTRNDDALLTFRIINTYLPQECIYLFDTGERVIASEMNPTHKLWVNRAAAKVYISTKALQRVREDNVKRIRAKIQNDKTNPRFLPTDSVVAMKRRINEEAWRRYARENNYSASV